MKQIYNFEKCDPPALNEKLLQAEIEKRRTRKQTALLALASILFQIVAIIVGMISLYVYPILAGISFVYAIISATGSGVVAIVYTRKGGATI